MAGPSRLGHQICLGCTHLLNQGSWRGGWCWYKVLPRLEKADHRVVARDLLSLATDRTPIAEISLDTWTDSGCQLLNAQAEPVILAGANELDYFEADKDQRVSDHESNRH